MKPVVKRRGRPALKDGSPKRSSFNTRLRDETKQHLETEARIAGRSLSEEIEFRLEKSLRDENAMIERLGGKETYEFLTVMGAVATLIQTRTGKSLTDWKTANAIGRAWRRLIADWVPRPPDEWISELKAVSDRIPKAPERPVPPRSPSRGLLTPRATDEEWKAYCENLEAFDKDMEKFNRQSADYEESIEEIQAAIHQKVEEFRQLTELGDEVLGLLGDRDD